MIWHDMIWLSDLLRLKAFIWSLPAKAILYRHRHRQRETERTRYNTAKYRQTSWML